MPDRIRLRSSAVRSRWTEAAVSTAMAIRCSCFCTRWNAFDFPHTIYLIEGDTRSELGTAIGGRCNRGGATTYQLTNDWLAYSRIGPSLVQNVWTKRNGEAAQQVTVYSTESKLDALANNGEVAVTRQGIRYIGSALTGVSEVSSDRGRAVHVAGQWYIINGRTLLRID